MIGRKSFLGSLFSIFFPTIMGGPEQTGPNPPDSTIDLTLPDGLTAHLENPQAYIDAEGKIFAATRPSSGVGGLVWMQRPDGSTAIIWAYDPANNYALGELVIWRDGYLRYVTVLRDDHTRLIVRLVPEWAP